MSRVIGFVVALALAGPAHADGPAPSAIAQALRATRSELDGSMPGPEAPAAAKSAWLALRKTTLTAFFEAHEAKATTGPDVMLIATGWHDLERWVRALTQFERALDRLPPGADRRLASVLRLSCLYRLERFDAALKGVERFRAANPSAFGRTLRSLERRAHSALGARRLIGQPAPALRPLRTIGVDRLTLDGLRGKVVLLEFFATWSPRCQRSAKRLAALHARHAGQGLVIVGVTRFWGLGFDPEAGRKPGLEKAAEAALAERWRTAMGLGYPLAFVREPTQDAYHVGRHLPCRFLIDRKGVLRYAALGEQGHWDALVLRVSRLLGE